jgi:hypothetical protein
VAATLHEPPYALQDISGRRSASDEFVEEAGEESFEDLAAGGEQAVRMAPLRDTSTVLRSLGEFVPFDDSYASAVFGEHARGEQSCHASAHYDGMFHDDNLHWVVILTHFLRDGVSRLLRGRAVFIDVPA